MTEIEALEHLRQAAEGWHTDLVDVKRAHAEVDVNYDGDEVTRVMLLLGDPRGDTWDIDAVSELRDSLGRFGAELGLPWVSLTLVPESERAELGVFAQ